MKDQLWKNLIESYLHSFNFKVSTVNKSTYLKKLNTKNPESLSNELFFKRYNIMQNPDGTMRGKVREVYLEDNILRDFHQDLRTNVEIQEVIARNFNTDYSMNFKKMIHNMKELVRMQIRDDKVKKDEQTKILRGFKQQLAEKISECQEQIQSKFEKSLINGESLIRECRHAYRMASFKTRDVGGMWALSELRQWTQKDNLFNLADFEYDSQKKNPFYEHEMKNWISQQLTRPLIDLKLNKYWLPEDLRLSQDENLDK